MRISDWSSDVCSSDLPVKAIRRMTKRAPDNMRGLTLFGRQLHLIDCQNLFCEISKYTRVSHPDIAGVSGRTTIKQEYRPMQAKMPARSEEHTSELQSLMRISYAVFCLKKKRNKNNKIYI